MKAAVGDRMVIAAARVDGPVRDGEVLSVGPDGGGPYRIRWSDTGTETLFFPGPDAHVQHLADGGGEQHAVLSPGDRGTGSAGHPIRLPAAPGVPPAHTKSWRIDVYLYEGAHATSAQAVLHGDAPAGLQGLGVARRREGDPDVPEIGDEVAVARALSRLSELLLGAASDDLTGVAGHPVTLER